MEQEGQLEGGVQAASRGYSEGEGGPREEVALILSSSLSTGMIMATTRPLVEPFCGSCGQKREARNKIELEPG